MVQRPSQRFTETPPDLAFEFQVRATLGEPIEQGTWEERRRRIIPILGGTALGPRRRPGLVTPTMVPSSCCRV